jgi:hypothetical protein
MNTLAEFVAGLRYENLRPAIVDLALLRRGRHRFLGISIG